MIPQRIQRRRTAGWQMPEEAVYVGRPTKWGNPFKVGEEIDRDSPLWPYIAETVPGGVHGFTAIAPTTNDIAVQLHLNWLIEQPHLMLSINELHGKNLVCWCPEGSPCHADALLAIANGGAA